MTLFALICALGAASMLLIAGYLIGVKRGLGSREQLREQARLQEEIIRLTREGTEYNNAALVESLRSIIEQVVTPLAHRGKYALDLSGFDPLEGGRTELERLLEHIAEQGEFWTVGLYDAQGLLLASSGNAKNLDRLSAISAMGLLFAERIERSDGTIPLSFMVHDAANMATLCRIFQVGEHRLLLSAATTGTDLWLSSLDPVLAKVERVLSQ